MNGTREHMNIASQYNYQSLIESFGEKLNKISQENDEFRKELILLGESDVDQYHDRWGVEQVIELVCFIVLYYIKIIFYTTVDTFCYTHIDTTSTLPQHNNFIKIYM
jgi:hypothetical protein